MSGADGSNIMSGKVNSEGLDAGSLMHVLDWLDSPTFLPTLRELIASTSLTVADDAFYQPKGRHDSRESVLTGKADAILSAGQREELLRWWLIHRRGAKLPTWDLVVCATDEENDRPALILVEAKAHNAELSDAGKTPLVRDTPDQQKRSDENHARIGKAIAEASLELGKIHTGVSISRDKSYQLSNRIAFSWKLASMGIPVALIYLGFVGDEEIARGFFESPESWLTAFNEHVAKHFPVALLNETVQCGCAGFSILPRARAVKRVSPPQDQRRSLA